MKRVLKVIGILTILYFFLAYALPKLVGIPLAAWQSYQAWNDSEKQQVDNLKLEDYEIIGVYEYKTESKGENHLVFIDTVHNKLTGFYFGTEDSGEHGIFHYGNPLLKFKLGNNNLEFEIGQRELYETTRNKVYKPSQKPKEETSVGISKSHLKYAGELTEFGFKLTCTSEYGDCWENKMEFRKIYD